MTHSLVFKANYQLPITALCLGLAAILGPLKAFLAIAPLGVPAEIGQAVWALAGAGWLVRGLVTRDLRLPHSRLAWLFALYLFAGWLSLLNATSVEEGFKELFKWFQIALGAWLAWDEIERGHGRWIVAALIGGGVLQAAIGYWQYDLRGAGPEHFRILDDHYRAYGSFEQPNPYGGYLGLLWPLLAGLGLEWGRKALAEKPRAIADKIRSDILPPAFRLLPPALCLLLSAFCLFGLYVSFSRGAWLGAAAAGIALILAWPRRAWVGVGLGLICGLGGWGLAQAGLLPTSITSRVASVADFTNVTDVRGANITPENFALVERLAHWQAAADMMRDAPWLGVGIGNYSVAYERYQLLNWPNALGHAHMIYLNVWAETGLLGLAAYGLLWGAVIALTIQAIRKQTGLARGMALGLLGAWAHLSAHQLVDNLYVNNLHLTLALLLGLLLALTHPPAPLTRNDFFHRTPVRQSPSPAQ
jgi:O-antigen ligase